MKRRRGDAAADAVRQALGRLSTATQMLILVIAAFVAVGLLLLASRTHGAVQTSLQGFATALLVSVSFGFVQSAFTGHITVDILRQDFMSSVSEIQPMYVPTDEFAGSAVPDPQFNKLIMEDLAATSTYWFRGISARFTAARIIRNNNANLEARLVLPDVTNHDGNALAARASYQLQYAVGENPPTRPELIASLRHTVELGIVGLLRARRHCGAIELVLVPNPSVDRFELFGDSIWVTYFSMARAGERFPRSARFEKESVIYAMQQRECRYIADGEGRKVSLPPVATVEEELRLLQEILGATYTADALEVLKNEFQRYFSSASSVL